MQVHQSFQPFAECNRFLLAEKILFCRYQVNAWHERNRDDTPMHLGGSVSRSLLVGARGEHFSGARFALTESLRSFFSGIIPKHGTLFPFSVQPETGEESEPCANTQDTQYWAKRKRKKRDKGAASFTVDETRTRRGIDMSVVPSSFNSVSGSIPVVVMLVQIEAHRHLRRQIEQTRGTCAFTKIRRSGLE